MKTTLLLLFSIALCTSAYPQKKDGKKLTPAQQQEVLSQLNLIDSVRLLKEVSASACLCIDSVKRAGKTTAKGNAQAIATCIEEQVSAYQITVKLMRSLKSPDKKVEISLDKNSPEYNRYYRDIERLARDSCASLISLLAVNDEAGSQSYSDNPEAAAAYNKGILLLRKEKYSEALPHFEEAVKADSVFAFAWDNIGICHRRTGDYNKAVAAYKKSLSIDPDGKTPLQNLPIAYELLKQYDAALEGYENIVKKDAKDPEGYFGKGRVYFIYKNDLEQALDNFCKAYNLYIETKSPYRADAEKLIGTLFQEMKKAKKEAEFDRILKENNIRTQ